MLGLQSQEDWYAFVEADPVSVWAFMKAAPCLCLSLSLSRSHQDPQNPTKDDSKLVAGKDPRIEKLAAARFALDIL